MQLRELGRTGLQISALSLGGAAIGQQYGNVTREEVTACVYAALDAGVNLIDTSAYYGKGSSEEWLGEILHGRRDQVYLSTKAGRFDYADFDFRPEAMWRSVEESLRRLRTDAVDILLAHDIEFATDFEAVFTDTADCLHKLKRQGKCRFIGMSGLPLGLLRRAIELCDLDVVISYSHYTLQSQRLLTELLPVAEEHGVGILNGSPLCLGVLTNQGPPPWHPGSERLKAIGMQAAEHCRQRGTDISFLGMQYCLQETRIASTITGTARVSELQTNLRALTTPIDAELLAEVQAILAPVMNETWASGNWKEPA
ncbi:MAG: aldo/keto reductase [Planctomycetes bacterium]|nr:aldo/keto reductase [Planctomycetota bacterium]